MPKFKEGDRVFCFHSDLIETVRGRYATVTRANPDGGTLMAYVDGIGNPSRAGYSFNPIHLELIETEPTDEEIAKLFGLKPPCPHCNGTGVAK